MVESMKYPLLFGLVGMFLSYKAFEAGPTIIGLFYVCVAISMLGIAIGYGSNNTKVFLKKPSGKMSFFGYILYWPYFLINYLNLALFRVLAKENAIDEIHDGIYLGCKPYQRDRGIFEELMIRSTLDVTSEFSEAKFILDSHEYLNIPILDTFPPTISQLKVAVEWLVKQRERGPVFIHCALGHGRSATIVAGYLLRKGIFTSVSATLEGMKSIRPGVGLNSSQLQVLHQYREII